MCFFSRNPSPFHPVGRLLSHRGHAALAPTPHSTQPCLSLRGYFARGAAEGQWNVGAVAQFSSAVRIHARSRRFERVAFPKAAQLGKRQHFMVRQMIRWKKAVAPMGRSGFLIAAATLLFGGTALAQV